MKFKLTWKIWLWLIFIVLSLTSIIITPTFLQKGVLITGIESNSTAFEQGLRQGQVITAIDGKQISSAEDFSELMNNKFISKEKVKTIFTIGEMEYMESPGIIEKILNFIRGNKSTGGGGGGPVEKRIDVY